MQVHAENGEGVALGQQAVFDAGVTGPEGHALSRPAVLEGEATARAIKLAAFVGVPLYVVHVMSKDALEEVRGCVRCVCLLVGMCCCGVLWSAVLTCVAQVPWCRLIGLARCCLHCCTVSTSFMTCMASSWCSTRKAARGSQTCQPPRISKPIMGSFDSQLPPSTLSVHAVAPMLPACIMPLAWCAEQRPHQRACIMRRWRAPASAASV